MIVVELFLFLLGLKFLIIVNCFFDNVLLGCVFVKVLKLLLLGLLIIIFILFF